MFNMWETPKKDQTKSKNRVPVCKHCLGTGHTAFTCPQRPKKPLKTTKPMKKVGNVGKKTQAAIAKWKRETNTNHQGYMICYLCGKWVTYKMPDHVKSRARAPERRTDLSNFKPVCAECNAKKLSKDVDEL